MAQILQKSSYQLVKGHPSLLCKLSNPRFPSGLHFLFLYHPIMVRGVHFLFHPVVSATGNNRRGEKYCVTYTGLSLVKRNIVTKPMQLLAKNRRRRKNWAISGIS